MSTQRRTKRGFGQITRLPSKRYRARYTGPDTVRHNAPVTFDTRLDAEAWLTAERRKISRDEWTPPIKLADAPKAATFGAYAERWLSNRELKPRTRAHYKSLLDRQLLPTFGDTSLKAITSESVRDWYADQPKDKPTLRAHAYGLLKTILGSALADEKIPINPCRIRAGAISSRRHQIKPATLLELEALVAAMPARYRLMVLLAAWCAMRFGELAELRRKDVDLSAGVIRIRRAVVRVDGTFLVGTPKSDAGTRDVAIPPHLFPVVKAHLASNITGGKDGLLFPATGGGHMAPSSLYRVFYRARVAAGRPDLRFHDLRHTGATLAAQTGATLAELMGRLGHSTPAAALIYQHAAGGRDAQIAKALSALVEAEANR